LEPDNTDYGYYYGGGGYPDQLAVPVEKQTGGGPGKLLLGPQVVLTGSLTNSFRNNLSTAISNLSSNCRKFFDSLSGGVAALSNSVSNLQFFDAHNSKAKDAGLTASEVLAGAADKSLVQIGDGVGALVLSNSDGISNGVVVGSLFYGLSDNYQNLTLIHEDAHYAYQMTDQQIWAAIQKYNPSFVPTNAHDESQSFTAYLSADCPEPSE